MRLLVGFALTCLALIALTTWLMVCDAPGHATPNAPPAEPKPAPATVTPPPTTTKSPAPVTTRRVPASQPTLTALVTAPSELSTRPATRWPNDPDTRAARRRLTAARQTLRDDPDHEAALRDELKALATLERWHEAVLTLGRLLQLHADDTDLRTERAALLLQLERASEAVVDLKRVVQREPQRARAWFNLAVAHQALGHLTDAERAWTRTIELEPSAEAHAQRGQVRLDLNAWAEAANDFEAALRTEPDAVDAAMNLSRACELLGRDIDARVCLANLLDRNPRCLPALNRLAELTWIACQSITGEQAACRALTIDLCRRSLTISPHQPGVETLLAQAQTLIE